MYTYHFRKAQRAGAFFIEFFKGTGRDGFFDTVFSALSSINPVVQGVPELWLNDEVIFNVNSDLGTFVLSKDLNEFSYIMADGNARCIDTIEQLLSQHPQFEKAA